jgi:hypothetical protein
MGEVLGQGLMAILSGGATGLLGVIFQRVFDHWKQKQEIDKIRVIQAHEVAMKKADAEIMAQEWAARAKVAQVEGETAREVADSQAFAASLTSEPKRYSEGVQAGFLGGLLLVFADVIRAVVRPGLTIYLAWIATELYNDSKAVLAVRGIDMVKLMTLHQQIVFTLLYLFTTCVLWWFGTRNKSPQPKLR